MKKAVRFVLPIILALCIIVCTIWYLFVYDRAFTRDMLLNFARYSESQGNHKLATWFYNSAYLQARDDDAVAIELAEQYKSVGNYTKAEYTLYNAIKDGGGADLYIALCKTYVEQDKLLDAVAMLNGITNEEVKETLEAMRPDAPAATPEPGFYNQYISVSLEASEGTLYASNSEYPSIKNPAYAEPIALTDGENTIYAVCVAENGLVSPVSIFGYTVGGVITKMEFTDKVMEAEIRKQLNVAEDAVLYTNDLWTIKNFTVPAKAKDYSDLEHMSFLETLTIESGAKDQLVALSALVNLTELSIQSTPVSQEELTTIAALPKLKKLTLQNCNITGITPLEKAIGLEYLDINSNGAIRNIAPLSTLINLQELNLKNNAVADLTPLSTLSNLTKLNLSSNIIQTLAPIGNLSRLIWLSANTNAITNLGDLSKLTALTYLDLSGNKLTDVHTLSSCVELKELNISTNELTTISHLSSLKKLEHFDFSYNQITKIPEFSTSCELITITGSNNKISSLDPLSGLKNLNIVNMDYNASISSVKALAKCPVLVEVNVYGTKVSNVSSLTEQSIIVNYNPVK